MDHFKDIMKGFHEHFGWFIWTLVAIGVVWFFNGGVNNPTAHRAYLKPLAPLDSGQVYGKYYAGSTSSPDETLNLPESAADAVRLAESAIGGILADARQIAAIHAGSSLVNGLSIDGIGGAKSSDPNTEYVRVISSSIANSPIQLSGLKLVGTALRSGIVIPKASELLVIGTTVRTSDVYLPPGGSAVIYSGISPVGGSFRVNSCTKYLDVATSTAAYNSCVAAHQNDARFYANEWRVYLGQTKELWKNSSDVIGLVNLKGNLIDAVSY